MSFTFFDHNHEHGDWAGQDAHASGTDHAASGDSDHGYADAHTHGAGHDTGADHASPLADLLGQYLHPHHPLFDNLSNLVHHYQDQAHTGHSQDALHSSIPIPDHHLGDSADMPSLDDLHHQHFDPSHTGDAVIGDPIDDMTHWHMQDHDDTCAVVSQQFVIESLTGEHVSESDLMHEAQEHGWYTPGGGTPAAQVGELLKDHGIPCEQEQNCTLSDIAQQLAEGHKVIAGVNGEEIWGINPGNDSSTSLADFPGIPGQSADHAVEVIGIDMTDPNHPMVILNDPGAPDGCGLAVPADVFDQSWSTSGHFMVHTDDPGTVVPGTADPTTVVAATENSTALGGYYVDDHTYHYNSDNTDRDVDTGAVVRQY